jgi:ketosteroid isomerase-like protein
MMSQENVEIVHHAHEALNNGDIDALVAICDAAFRLDMSDRVLNPAVYEGHDGIRRFYGEVRDVWANYTWEPEQLIESGEQVVALLRSSGTGRGSGVEIQRQTAMVWTVHDRRATSLRFFRDRAEALEAVGLQERAMPQESQKRGAKAKLRPVNGVERQYRVRPECRAQAQEAVAQMRALGLRVELQRGDLLVFTVEDTIIDHRVGETLERVWPGWRECVSD